MSDEIIPQVSLINLCEGAAVEMFDDELQRVLLNIMDPNTKAAAKREITLKVEIMPTENRQMGEVKITTSSKPASGAGVKTILYMGKQGARVVASERNIRQLSFDEAARGVQ